MSLYELINKGVGSYPPTWSNLKVKSIETTNPVENCDAAFIQSVPVSGTAPNDTEVLTYSSGTGEWYAAPSSGGGSIPYDPINVDLYISQSGGDDANDGLSAGQAVQTWNRLLTIGSGYNVQQITIHLVAGETYFNLGVANTDGYVDDVNTKFTNICDFRPFGASIVKVITDTSGLDTNSPSATGNWTPDPSTITYNYIDHAAVGAATSSRLIYNATNDRYYSTDINQNTATRSYLVGFPDGSLLTPMEYYDTTDLATLSFNINTIVAADQKLIFEKVNLTETWKCYANILVRGCITTDSFWHSIGNDLIIRDSYFNYMSIYSGNALVYQCFSDDAVEIKNSKANVSYSITDSLYIEKNCDIALDSFVGQSTVFCDESRLRFQGGGAGSLGIATCSIAYISDLTLNLGSDIRVLSNSSCRLFNHNGTGFSLILSNNSFFDGQNCILNANGSTSAVNATKNSFGWFTNATLNDSSGSGSGPIFLVDSYSKISFDTFMSSTTGRTAHLLRVINNSELNLNGITITSALTSNDLVLVEGGSQVYNKGSTVMNTSQNMIQLHKGSIYKCGNASVFNSGAGTVLQKGTSPAGAFAFDTTYTVVASDEMCLAIEI